MEDAVEEIDVGKNAAIFQLFSCLHTDTIRELIACCACIFWC